MRNKDALESEIKYAKNMVKKWNKVRVRAENCLRCVTAKTYKQCPENCEYLK